MTRSLWPLVPIGEFVTKSDDRVRVAADQKYPNFGIYSFGRGLFPKPPIDGASSSATTLFRASAGQFVYSRLFAFEGAYGVVSDEFDGCFVSNEFPLFDFDARRVLPRYVEWFFRSPEVWPKIARLTTGLGNRRRRIKPEALLKYMIPLPPLEEQHRLVDRINRLAVTIDESASAAEEADALADGLLLAAHHKITERAPHRRLGDIAPLMRRPADIHPSKDYPQVSVRSFGKGTFHKPPLRGTDITWQKPHLVKQGDILVSNIKAWEGAISVAGPEDDGRFGSHRYLTFEPIAGVATGDYLCFHLLTAEGLHHVGAASPGSADRNRTLSAKAALDIPIPLPSIDCQLWFGRMLSQVGKARALRRDATATRNAILPSVLNRAFKGELA